MTTARAHTPLFIIFMDLTRFNAQASRTDDAVLAALVDQYYELVGDHVARAGGTLVKFIGDAALVVFAVEHADIATGMLIALKHDVDALMERAGWDCRLNAKAHAGEVIAGPFGAKDEKRFDVIGSAVNITARLESHGITLSAEAFRKLGATQRQRFRKHTPPVSYIRTEDPRPKAHKGA